jgi:hypothetical protein
MAKKLTKAEKAAKRRRKEATAKRLDAKPLTNLHFWAASVDETAQAMIDIGINEDIVIGWIYEQRPPIFDDFFGNRRDYLDEE